MTRRPNRATRAVQRRIYGLAGLGLLAFAMLLGRAAQLMAVDAEWLRERAEAQRSARLRLDALRGEIRDRNGQLLAVSATVESVAASPRRIEHLEHTVVSLAKALGVPRRELRKKLSSDKSFVWLGRWIGSETADRVRGLALAGVHLHPERRRFYPNRSLAAAVLGFADRDGRGLSGVELQFDRLLRGQSTQLPARRDGRGEKVALVRQGNREGHSLGLSLDAGLQHFAERALERALVRTRARHATLIAMDPRSGEILALAEAPSFNPNRFWLEDPAQFRARAIVDVFEPGSTLKPFVIAAALEAGVVEPDDRFDCENGAWRVRNRTIHDFKPHGILDVRDILRLSSNIGAAKIANRLGSAELVDGLRRFGFGERTASGYPGESRGLLRDLRERQVVERANLAFGHGISVSAVQLVAAGATLANGGLRVTPRLLRQTRVDVAANAPERVLSAATTRLVMSMLRDVVDDGTGRAAALPNLSVAGKTGTAQKVKNGRYSHDDYVASFLGFVPAVNARLVVAVVLDEPRGVRTGGATAAPVFREVAGFAAAQFAISEAAE